MNMTYELIRSWADRIGNVTSMEEILNWVAFRNENSKVDIKKFPFSYVGFWHYDEADGFIRNNNNSFFQIAGIQKKTDGKLIEEQPIILQKEIGFLGIICQMIKGKLNFLMQAKIEPGNINVVQISPTIQATKSNFTTKHGGAVPAYLEYFKNAKNYSIIVDQLQSEQAARFLGKRNRNIIVCVDENVKIKVLPSHKWMTLGQIKECMRIENLVNMDTRTVLSCIPFSDNLLNAVELEQAKRMFHDNALFLSIFKKIDMEMKLKIFNCLNDYKMMNETENQLVPLKNLNSWELTSDEIKCKYYNNFKVIFCKIEIKGREVRKWEQPLFEASGIGLFGCFTTIENGIRKFLVKIKPEIGCFDFVELGPAIQLEPVNLKKSEINNIEKVFLEKLEKNQGVVFNNLLSEEGGRFYHEQNRNVIIEISSVKEIDIPDNYFWVDYATLNHMIQFNNIINIQLRNILALL